MDYSLKGRKHQTISFSKIFGENQLIPLNPKWTETDEFIVTQVKTLVFDLLPLKLYILICYRRVGHIGSCMAAPFFNSIDPLPMVAFEFCEVLRELFLENFPL